MSSYPFLFFQLVFSAVLIWSCFCRLVVTDDQTVREVRLAIWLEGVASMLLLVAPILPLMAPKTFVWVVFSTPSWAWLLLLASAMLVQVVTSKHWKHGTPTSFMKDPA